MELRNHPLMTRFGLPNWPPVWAPADPRDGKSSLRGEIGRLKYVLCRASENTCFLITMYNGGAYIGSLLFDGGVLRADRQNLRNLYWSHD
jgi:hypothetical protein